MKIYTNCKTSLRVREGGGKKTRNWLNQGKLISFGSAWEGSILVHPAKRRMALRSKRKPTVR